MLTIVRLNSKEFDELFIKAYEKFVVNHYKLNNNVECSRMCMLSEWDESKPRDCETCSGRFIEPTLSPPQTEQTVEQDKMSSHKVDT